MRGKVLVDLDGVVVNLYEGIRRTLANEGIQFDYTKIEDYDFNGDTGCDSSKVRSLLRHKECYERSVFYDGAVEAINKLKEVVDVYGYTLCPPNPFIMVYRQNQMKQLGVLGDMYIDEKPILMGYDAVFEDRPDLLLKYAESGCSGLYMIEQSHNKGANIGNNIKVMKDFPSAVEDFLLNY